MDSFRQVLNKIVGVAQFMGLFLVALWIIYLVDSMLLRGRLKQRFGLRPRTRFSLLCILISPFLHVDSRHLAGNSIPVFVLGSLVMVQGQLTFWLTTLVIAMVAGLGIWIFGTPGTQHMGASGLILGYLGFMLFRALFAPNLATIIVAVIVALLYLGLVTQVWPTKEGVSRTGHLFGFLGGVLGAALSTWLPMG